MTAQELFDIAVSRSNLNDPDLMDSTEWLAHLSDYEQRVFMTAARFNPDFFGREGLTNARGSSTASWSLATAPGNVAAVSLAEVSAVVGSPTGLSTGDEVYLVSRRHPEHAIAPRAYIRNKTLYEYGGELGDDASNYVSRLKIFYSFMPSRRTATSDNLDIPDELSNLVSLPLASLLAMRDQRPDEAQAMMSEYIDLFAGFVSYIQGFDEGATREFEQVPAASPPVQTAGE